MTTVYSTDFGVVEPVSSGEEEDEEQPSPKTIGERRDSTDGSDGAPTNWYSAKQVVQPQKPVVAFKTQRPPREHPWYKPLFDTPAKRRSWWILLLACVLTGIILLARSLKKVSSTENGVQYNTHSKQLSDAVKNGALVFGPPGFTFIKFPSTFITVDLPDDTCLSQDGLPVVISVSFQYQMTKDWILPAILKYRNFDTWANVVEAAAMSATQHACSEYIISQFEKMRGTIQSTMEEYLKLKLEGENSDGESGVYAKAIGLQLRNLELPPKYKDAVDEKQAAIEDIALAKNQRTQETTKAETKRRSAQEQAVKILDSARSDANVTMTEALLKANETLYAFQIESQVLARVKATHNLTIDGLLSYVESQFLARTGNLKVLLPEPAQLSRKENL